MSSTTASTITTDATGRTAAITDRRGIARSIALAGCGLVAAGAFTFVGSSGPAAASSDIDIDFELPLRELPNLGGLVDLPGGVTPGDFAPLPGPGDDSPLSELPFPGELGRVPEITIPGDLVPLPVCAPVETDWVTAVHTDNGDGTGTAALAYSGPTNPCDSLIVVHSIELNAAMEYVAEVETKFVPLVELAAAPGAAMDVVVAMDPCITRLLTNIEGVTLDDDTYVVDCTTPVDTTTPDDTPVDTTMPNDTPDTTMPPADTPGDTPPPNTVPGDGQLPQTGSESMVMAVIGGALIILGGTLAGAVRGLQRR